MGGSIGLKTFLKSCEWSILRKRQPQIADYEWLRASAAGTRLEPPPDAILSCTGAEFVDSNPEGRSGQGDLLPSPAHPKYPLTALWDEAKNQRPDVGRDNAARCKRR